MPVLEIEKRRAHSGGGAIDASGMELPTSQEAAPIWAEGTASTRGVPIGGPKGGLFYWVKSGCIQLYASSARTGSLGLG